MKMSNNRRLETLLFVFCFSFFAALTVSSQQLINPYRHTVWQSLPVTDRMKFAQTNRQDSILLSFSTPDYRYHTTKPWLAAAEVVVLNIGLNIFDRYILKAPWAIVTLDTIKYNLKHGFVWDNDFIATNFFWHPYNGGLYFNAARSNGLNFWQSIPFAVGGSLMWECFGENGPASLNDLIATSIGGIALGEITHRLSYLILDDSKRGWRRLGRELFAGIISPMDMINRIAGGDAWRYRPYTYEGKPNYSEHPFVFGVSVANRFITDFEGNRGSMNMALNMRIIYGKPIIDDIRSPYDFFTANVDFNIIGNQPLVSNVNALGLIYGKEWNKKRNYWLAGIFQHFHYSASNPLIKGGSQPYEYAETASFGGGLLYMKPRKEEMKPRFSGGLFANLILLGASESDYFAADNRDYNLGNGYSIKLNTFVSFGKRWDAELHFGHYHIFTSYGYGSAEAEINGLPENTNFSYANVQGNQGNARLSSINVGIGVQLSRKLRLSAEQRFYFRKTHYNYLDDVETSSTENCFKLTYTIFNVEN
jgi:hypothetical protein